MAKFLTNEDIANIFIFMSFMADNAEFKEIKNDLKKTIKNFYLEYQDVLEVLDDEDITFM